MYKGKADGEGDLGKFMLSKDGNIINTQILGGGKIRYEELMVRGDHLKI